jgi:hypothetical protein
MPGSHELKRTLGFDDERHRDPAGNLLIHDGDERIEAIIGVPLCRGEESW